MMASVHASLRATGRHRAARAACSSGSTASSTRARRRAVRRPCSTASSTPSAAASPTSTPATSRPTCGARTGGRERLHGGRARARPARRRDLRGGRARLEPGDLLAVVTDGATEALSPADDEFGDERVRRALRAGGRRERAAAPSRAPGRRGGRLDRARRLHRRPHRPHPESRHDPRAAAVQHPDARAVEPLRPARRRPRCASTSAAPPSTTARHVGNFRTFVATDVAAPHPAALRVPGASRS